MLFMNEYEIEEAVSRHASHPVLGPATRTLYNLMRETNAKSDGWPYWNKPCKAAAKLQELIQGNRSAYWDDECEDATPAKLKAAYSPLKSFRTRQGFEFAIVEPR